jgi:hypothetical protein
MYLKIYLIILNNIYIIYYSRIFLIDMRSYGSGFANEYG